MWLLSHEAWQGELLSSRGLGLVKRILGLALPRIGAGLPQSLVLLQQVLLVPLHQQGLQLLLLLRGEVPQLRVFGDDTLKLGTDLAHHRAGQDALALRG